MQNSQKLWELRHIRQKHPFHLVNRSPWPFFGSMAVISVTTGAVLYMHRYNSGGSLLFWGVIFLTTIILFWLRDVIIEATYEGQHTKKVQQGLRLGMKLFIVSEIMFFFAFFWAFFHAALSPHTFLGVMWPPRGIIPMYIDGWTPETNKQALQTAYDSYVEISKWLWHELPARNSSAIHTLLQNYLALYNFSDEITENKNMLNSFVIFNVLDTECLTFLINNTEENNRLEYFFSWLILMQNVINNDTLINDYLFNETTYTKLEKNFENALAVVLTEHPAKIPTAMSEEIINTDNEILNFNEWLALENPWQLKDTPHWVKITGCATPTDDGYRYAFCYLPLFNPYSLPLAATFILLSSGVTLHTAGLWFKFANEKTNWPLNLTLRNIVNKMPWLKSETNTRTAAHRWVTFWLTFTIFLGIIFTIIQSYEYFSLLPFGINDSVFGSCFYLLTGFHGFHVILGTIALIICLIRHLQNHFTSTVHVGFECAAWYWHFVDGVWLFVYSIIYWWSAPLKQPYLWFNELDENGNAALFSCGEKAWTWDRVLEENLPSGVNQKRII